MFQIPDWEDDVPKNENFVTTNIKQKKTKIKNVMQNSTKNVDKQAKGSSLNNLFQVKTNQKTKSKSNTLISTNNNNTSKFVGQFIKNTNQNINNNQNKQKLDKKSKIAIPFKSKTNEDTSKSKNSENTTVETKTNGNLGKKRNIKNCMYDDLNTDKSNEILLSAKRRKFNNELKNDDNEDLLFKDENLNTKLQTCKNSKIKEDKIGTHSNKIDRKSATKVENNYNFKDQSNNSMSIVNNYKDKKKDKLKKILSHRRPINVDKSSQLRERMLERLKAAQFRYLNEKLYTSTGPEAKQLFQSDPAAFQTYHDGYRQQLKKWPVNPLALIVSRIKKMPKSFLIADMGCGEAALSKRVPNKVRSFDLVATSPEVEACDMAHTSLLQGSIDVAVYCLALMGTNLTQYLLEANRVLKNGGHLLIAEVESRFDDVEAFTGDVQRLGFKLKNLDKSHKVFFFIEFIKVTEPPTKKAKLPDISLKPCLYKKR